MLSTFVSETEQNPGKWKYLSGVQDLYLCPGSLKLFSFAIITCTHQTESYS